MTRSRPCWQARYELLRSEMDHHGIDYALVLSSYLVNERRPSVDEILKVVEDDPRLGVVAGVSYELAGEFGVPVRILTRDTLDPRGKLKYAHPLEVDEVAVDFRDVTFVICHIGNPWITDAMEVIYSNDNVVGDIAGFTLKHFEERFERYMLRQVEEVIAFAGDRSKLLYGTDWATCDMGSYLLHSAPPSTDDGFPPHPAQGRTSEVPDSPSRGGRSDPGRGSAPVSQEPAAERGP